MAHGHAQSLFGPKRTSETEEQRKERLRIRCEKDRARRRTKGKSADTDDYEKQRLATLKRLMKRGEADLTGEGGR